MLYAILAIFFFGLLIAVHEFGHFLTAKLCGVRVNEFSIGMGPLLWSHEGKETLYALRLFPIGGFCAMEGEDEESDDPAAFNNQGFWQKILILAAGAGMNFLAGLLLVLLFFNQSAAFYVPVIGGLFEGFPLEGEEGLMVGDRVVSINGHHIFSYSDLLLYLEREQGEPMDVVLKRDGEKVVLKDFPLEKRAYEVNGQTVYKFGITPSIEKATLAVKLREGLYNTIYFVRSVILGLEDLIGGRAGLDEMSGPIGIVATMTEVGEQTESTSGVLAAVWNVLYFVAFVAVNLAVMNLLPIPALDGGRIFLLVVTTLFTALTGKKLDSKYEGYVHTAGLVLLLALMAVVALHDVFRLMGG